MIVKNAYYPKSMPTKIVIETLDGAYCATNLTPFRVITEAELEKLAIFTPAMGDEIPDHTLKFYGLDRDPASANVVRRMRHRLGLSQSQLAAAAGLNVRQIQKIESGEILLGNITLANAARLAEALGITMEALVSENERNGKNENI